MAKVDQPTSTQTGEPQPAASVAPGALSALLAELVRAPEPLAPEPPPGTRIGRFELLRKLGTGGFGVVWEARDRQLGRSVAFKLVRPGDRAEQRGQSLLLEAEAAARLSHDNLAALYDVGQSEHGPYLVLELLHGKTLADRLGEGPLPRGEALRILREVARGVAHAHREGVIHRDLKPANVFVCDDGRVKVLDFGLAHAFGRRRQSGGTPAYMAPEQWREAPEDERTDVFALGVMAYQLLAGTLPFEDGKATTGGRPAPALEVPGAPELGGLVARALEKDPVRRPRDAAELLKGLDAALAALALAGAGAEAPVRTRRHPGLRLAGLVAAGALLGLLAAGAILVARRPPPRADGRLLVTVADVVNETGEKELDVLSALLVTSLEQSRKLEVMTQSRTLDLAARAGRQGATRVDEGLGRAVGLAANASALLLPAVRRLGSSYAVEMRAIDPVKDEHLFTVSDRSSTKEGLFELLDRLSEKARRELKEDPAELERSRIQLGQAMTRSVEAYQHYVAGVDALLADGQRAVALREELRAIELDPEFAAAHAYLASVYEGYNRDDLAKPHWQLADRYLDRMPEKERTILLLLRAAGKMGRPDPAERLRLGRELRERWPEDKHAVYFACRYDRPKEAPPAERPALVQAQVAALRRVLELDPANGSLLYHLMGRLGPGTPEAVAAARRAVAVRPGDFQLVMLGRALAASGQREEAATLARRALEQNGLQSAVMAGSAWGLLERIGLITEGVPYFRRLLAGGQNELERQEARWFLTFALASTGQVKELLQLCERDPCPLPEVVMRNVGVDRHRPTAAALASVRREKDPAERRYWLTRYGDLAGAAAAGALVPKGEPDPKGDLQRRALEAMSQGRNPEAIPRLRELMKLEAAENVHAYDSRYLLAEALLASGDAAGAAAVPGSYPDPALDPRAQAFYNGYPELLLVRARAHQRLGQRAEAVGELDALLTWWRLADPDLPLLVEAKAMRARLAAPPR